MASGSLKMSSMTQVAMVGTERRDTLKGSAGDNHISGGAGNDKLYGYDGNDHLNGGDGGDTIEGGDGNDIIEGRQSDDIIDGGNGDDIYVFNKDSDHDEITDSSSQNGDTLRFGEGITLDKLYLRSIHNDLTIGLIDGSASVTVKSWFRHSSYEIDFFEFSDGERLTKNELMTRVAMVGTESRDTLKGSAETTTSQVGLERTSSMVMMAMITLMAVKAMTPYKVVMATTLSTAAKVMTSLMAVMVMIFMSSIKTVTMMRSPILLHKTVIL